MKMLRLVEIYQRNGKYHSERWTYENSIKYVFNYGRVVIEAGYYIHFQKDKITPLNHIIELSTSYGCPFHCKYCASSAIKEISLLPSNVVYDVFDYIYTENELSQKENIEVSFMGIGDMFFTSQVIMSVIPLIVEKDKRIKCNISSCYWTKAHIVELETLYDNIKTIQMTYISSVRDIFQAVIPGMPKNFCGVESMLDTLYESRFSLLRINYVMVKGINDTEKDFNRFLNIIERYKDKITVRISRMNITNASDNNELYPPLIEDMQKLEALLKEHNIRAYMFYSYQNDSMNCGQLITECEKSKMYKSGNF